MNKSRVQFKNPDNLPIENVTIPVTDNGVIRNIKALDPHWVEKKDLILYERPPSGAELVLGAVDTWKSKMEGYLDYLKWLLELEYHRFWSNILYHPTCMDMLVSFIQETNPPYISPHDIKDVQKLYEDIRRLVLITFSRLITNKESKTQWMTKEYMADLIYDNFIFTIPILWDLCLTYGADNQKHISHLIIAVFSLQPKYYNDAVQALIFVQEAFKYIILQVNKDYESDEPPNLPETFKGFGEIRRPTDNKTDKITFSILKDLVIHMLDTAMTLRIFVEVYPKSVDIVMKTNFVLSIVQLYEYGIPLLYEKLVEVGDETSVLYTEVEGYIDLARSELIDTLKEILAGHKSAIFSGEGSLASSVEAYLSVMMDALSERLLIKDYNACYPVCEDLEMLRQAYPDIDTVKTDFILQAIYSNIDDPIPEISNDNRVTNGHIEIPTTTDNEPGPSTDTEIPDNVREQSLICEVKDILPHLGDGFILKCLQHYSFNSERVINAILEDNLADSLRGLDTSLPIIPEDPLDKKYLETGIQRLNVFDGDQFDIMTRDDVDVSKIHVGKKKEKYRNFKDMLNDKTEVKSRSDIYSKYNIVCDEEAMYSDEYDDTYDSDGVAPTADQTEELRRPFVTPRALMTGRRDAREESEESEEVEEEKPAKSRMDFCVNPEEMRARREANTQARRGRGHRPPPPRNIDVVGKPKGQGQEKETLLNRDRKEKHKSSRGNHSRRQGAQWKRSQGMMPS